MNKLKLSRQLSSLGTVSFIKFVIPVALVFTIVLSLVPVSVLANHVDAEISISSISPIYVSVSNLSGSTNINERLLTMTSPAEITVKGQAQCKKGSAVESVQLLFGPDYIETTTNGHTLWGSWDSSPKQMFQSTNNAAYSITYEMNMSPTWDLGTLITLEPNAVKVVEDNLKSYVNNGGSAIDFLREDGSFETAVVVNSTVTCERDGNVFFNTVSQSTTMHILYKGDSNLEPQTVGQNPDQIDSNEPGPLGYGQNVDLPKPGLTLASPFYFVGNFFEGIGTFFAFGNSAKAERYLALSERRLAEANLLAERGDERALIAVARYEEQFAKAKDRSERRGLNAVNFKAPSREDGDDDVEDSDGDGALDLLVRVTDATTKHLTVLDLVLERVPEQARAAIESAKERSMRGQIESLRGIAQIDPATAALVFDRANQARASYYIKFGSIDGESTERDSGSETDSVFPNDFLRGFEEYAEFGRELSEMAEGINIGERTVRQVVERATARNRQILEEVMNRVPEETRERIQVAIDKSTPELMGRSAGPVNRPTQIQRTVPATVPQPGVRPEVGVPAESRNQDTSEPNQTERERDDVIDTRYPDDDRDDYGTPTRTTEPERTDPARSDSNTSTFTR